jgi:hypothetical protein
MSLMGARRAVILQRPVAAAVASPYPSGTSLYLDFVNAVYGASTFASASPTTRTLAQLVTGAVTPTASGMLIGAGDDVTVPLSPAVLSGTWFSNTVGTFYVEAVIAYDASGGFPRIWEMSDGSDANRLIARYNGATNIGGVVTIGSADTELVFTPYTLAVKFAIAYDASGIAVCLNGGTVQTDAAVVPTLTGLQLGNRNTTKNRQLDGNVKKFAFYVTKLGNAALQTLTT